KNRPLENVDDITIPDQKNMPAEIYISTQRLRERILQLKPILREVLLLHLVGYTDREISGKLDVTPGAIKGRRFRALQVLKRLYSSERPAASSVAAPPSPTGRAA